MKKVLIMFMALVWTAALMAQRIAVVDSNGSTKIFKTLQAAIEGAADNSIIYLPGGGFPIADEVKITKKLTIIGIGHKIKSDNPDGYTTISGNLFFNQGSDGSALMGCYVTGNVHICNEGEEVDDILIKYCNINESICWSNKSRGIIINQNYIRGGAHFCFGSGTLTNNIVVFVSQLSDGYISNNIIVGGRYGVALYQCTQTEITNNIIFSGGIFSGGNCQSYGNMCVTDWNDMDNRDNINIGSVDWKDVFEDYLGVTPNSDFHFKGEYTQYQGQVGIYAGDGFSYDQLAPVPFIVSKSIDPQTDASGHLNVRIRVKAGGTE